MTRTRENKLTVFLDDDELAMLKGIAEQAGQSQSEAVRQLIRKGHDENQQRKTRRRS